MHLLLATEMWACRAITGRREARRWECSRILNTTSQWLLRIHYWPQKKRALSKCYRGGLASMWGVEVKNSRGWPACRILSQAEAPNAHHLPICIFSTSNSLIINTFWQIKDTLELSRNRKHQLEKEQEGRIGQVFLILLRPESPPHLSSLENCSMSWNRWEKSRKKWRRRSSFSEERIKDCGTKRKRKKWKRSSILTGWSNLTNQPICSLECSVKGILRRSKNWLTLFKFWQSGLALMKR